MIAVIKVQSEFKGRIQYRETTFGEEVKGVHNPRTIHPIEIDYHEE